MRDGEPEWKSEDFRGQFSHFECVVTQLLIDACVAGAARASDTVSPHLGSLPAA